MKFIELENPIKKKSRGCNGRSIFNYNFQDEKASPSHIVHFLSRNLSGGIKKKSCPSYGKYGISKNGYNLPDEILCLRETLQVFFVCFFRLKCIKL